MADEHLFGEQSEVVVVLFTLVFGWGSQEHVCYGMEFAWYVFDR